MYGAFSISSAPGQQGPPGTPPGRGIPPLGCPGPAGIRGTRGVAPTVRNSRAGPLPGVEYTVVGEFTRKGALALDGTGSQLGSVGLASVHAPVLNLIAPANVRRPFLSAFSAAMSKSGDEVVSTLTFSPSVCVYVCVCVSGRLCPCLPTLVRPTDAGICTDCSCCRSRW